MLTDQDIFNRYQTKQIEFEKRANVTLMGHSLFDMWEGVEKTLTLKGQSVANLGLSGTSTRQYLDVIAKPQHIQHLGKTVFIFLGVNDIVKEPDYSPQQVLDWISQIIQETQPLAEFNTRYFLLEATPVNRIETVTNAEIQAMNAYFNAHCPAPLVFIPTYDKFLDNEGNLDRSLTVDGLHYNEKGYAILREILEAYL
ncbi:MAG: acylneuraminate cytidylyltransferase [Haemophilus paraphrohaemolyticus]|jgi:acylneuraminate cytidylyltransferase|uniref:SGNH/GDSL hydrolase family protein n=1 Tax=Haemophilus paraphrohaemolyticus TaxID=736 RepID=UPI001EB7FA63|nr:SGNH/GDSL hydrolase family protein [Haemophilus paraphrohaemolyticus]MBS6674191.1 acylneuraminate cytidylyltransferase [Haemophilus paraphrohaemolyticus]